MVNLNMTKKTIAETVREAFAEGKENFIFEGVFYERKGKTFIGQKKAHKEEEKTAIILE